MSDIGVKQGCLLSPVLKLYNDEFETYLDGIDGDSLCLFNTMAAILLYIDDVILSKLGVGLQRLLDKPYKLCNSSCLDIKLSKTKP